MSHRRFIVLIFILVVGMAVPFAHTVAQQPASNTHVVQAGENLFRIGLQYGFTAEQLALANGISDPAQIYVGQVLVIPLPIGGGEEFVTTSAPTSISFDDPSASSTQPQTVTDVQPIVPLQAEVVTEVQPAVTEPEVTVAETTASGETVHVVQANEGLASIARAYGVSWVDIARVNNIVNPDYIYAGQELVIPNPSLTPPADYGQPPAPADASRYILVELGKQKISAIQDSQVVREVIVSTGLPGTPTVIGDFNIYTKLPEQTMYGPGYYLPGVPWVMYFYGGYAIHGTYWHNNFGTPMSHGCVNLPTDEAEWFYNFAQVGTLVRVVP